MELVRGDFDWSQRDIYDVWYRCGWAVDYWPGLSSNECHGNEEKG